MIRLLTSALLLATALTAVAQNPADGRSGANIAAGARGLSGLFVKSPVEKFREAISSIAEFQVYEGVPNRGADPAAFKAAKDRTDLIAVAGSFFFPKALEISAPDREKLGELFRSGKAFSPGEVPPCGIFHADYLIVWNKPGADWNALIGLDCQEVQAVGADVRFGRYIPPSGYAILSSALAKSREPNPAVPN